MAILPADPTPPPVKRRNRLATMERILRATGEIMGEIGVEKAGINAIAERAAVNKVLVYRYFGGWNGLIEAFVQRGFFLSLLSERGQEALPTNPPLADRGQLWQTTIHTVLEELRERPAARALLRWEMANSQTELAQRLAQLRSEAFEKAIAKLAPAGDGDAAATVALLWGGLVYLTLVSEHRSTLIDVDLQTPAGWGRIKTAVGRLVSPD